MFKKLAVAAATVLAVLGMSAVPARAATTIPPLCVSQDIIVGLHLQIGYCPG